MRAYPTSHRHLATCAVALAAVLAFTGCSRWPLRDVLNGVIHPRIVPSAGASGTQVVEREFEFEATRVRLSVPVDSAVYAGAVSAQKKAIFIRAEKPVDWAADYYRAFVTEEHQDEFYASLLVALHAARDQQGLDSARYVELVTAMAQLAEYRVDPGSLAPKFPIETFVDGYGDCDDKTLLAAGLLSRDGYDVAVLAFAPEKHVALGIRAPGLDYKGTGYGYVEMTEPSLVGIPAQKLAGGIELASQPVVIRIGEGEGVFSAGEQVEYIRRRLVEIEEERARLAKLITRYNAQVKRHQTSLESAKRKLEAAGAAVTQEAVSRYNAQVEEHNALIAKTNRTVDDHNRLVEAQRFAAEHQTARPQVYQTLRKVKL